VKIIAPLNHDIHPSIHHHKCTFVIAQKITTHDLAHTVSLASLTLQTVLLIFVVIVAMSGPSTVADMVHSVLAALLDLLGIHVIQNLEAKFDISKELVTSGLGEIFTNNDTQKLEVFGFGGHGVSWDDPGALTELLCESEFVVMLVELCIKAERYEWETLAVFLGHDDKAELLKGVGEIVSRTGEVSHDGTVSVLSETDELVVLANDLGCSFGEVEGKGSLVGT